MFGQEETDMLISLTLDGVQLDKLTKETDVNNVVELKKSPGELEHAGESSKEKRQLVSSS